MNWWPLLVTKQEFPKLIDFYVTFRNKAQKQNHFLHLKTIVVSQRPKSQKQPLEWMHASYCTLLQHSVLNTDHSATNSLSSALSRTPGFAPFPRRMRTAAQWFSLAASCSGVLPSYKTTSFQHIHSKQAPPQGIHFLVSSFPTCPTSENLSYFHTRHNNVIRKTIHSIN